MLHILRSLPTLSLSSEDAIDTCTAAAAALHNIFVTSNACVGSSGQHPPNAIVGAITADPCLGDILTVVVRFGMLGPAALQPLPPGRKVHMELGPHDEYPGGFAAAALNREGFWTPLRVCGHLLQMLLSMWTKDKGGNFSEVVRQGEGALRQLVDEGISSHLLGTVLKDVVSK